MCIDAYIHMYRYINNQNAYLKKDYLTISLFVTSLLELKMNTTFQSFIRWRKNKLCIF